MDRRIQRTRDVLHQALISLMIEKGYEVLTVQDILDRANIGRSTFYTHFTGKQDLLMNGLKDLRKGLLTQQRSILSAKAPATERGFAFSLVFFEHVHSHRSVYHAIVGRQSGTVVMSELREILTELVRNETPTIAGSKRLNDLPGGAVIEFVVSSLMAVVTWWMKDKGVSPMEANRIFLRLTLG